MYRIVNEYGFISTHQIHDKVNYKQKQVRKILHNDKKLALKIVFFMTVLIPLFKTAITVEV